jgi:hypothetical protein
VSIDQPSVWLQLLGGSCWALCSAKPPKILQIEAEQQLLMITAYSDPPKAFWANLIHSCCLVGGESCKICVFFLRCFYRQPQYLSPALGFSLSDKSLFDILDARCIIHFYDLLAIIAVFRCLLCTDKDCNSHSLDSPRTMHYS